MTAPDRVITTDRLLSVNLSCDQPWLQVGRGLLDRADPMGLHVVIPRGPIPHTGGDRILIAELQLSLLGKTEPTAVPVLLPLSWYEALPTTFHSLRVAATLVEDMVHELNAELAPTRTFDGAGHGDTEDREEPETPGDD